MPVMADQSQVPVRTIVVTIALVAAAVVLFWLVVTLARIEGLLIVAAFFAVLLSPPVDWLQHHLHLRRALATFIVFFTGVVLVVAMLYAFIRPLVDQVQSFSDSFPKYVADARAGKGTVGKLVKKYKIDDWVERNRDNIQESISRFGTGALKWVRSIAVGVALLITTLVLSFLMVLHGPSMLSGALGMLSPPTRQRVSAVGADSAKAVTGYMFGNLLISVIAGTVTFFSLWGFGVPFRGVLALWVGFADLIPLVGATLGAVPTVGVAFLHSTTAGIGMIIVFVVYQQFENHVLQVVIMSKTVQLNQLFVLVSILVGVELFGFIGALLAIPAAGVLQVVVRDLYENRQGRLKPEPTVGADEVPVRRAKRRLPRTGS
jgi:predicted PurR-regulated permease PerM